MYEYFGYGKTTKALASYFGAANFYDDNVEKLFIDEEGNTIYPSSAYKPNTTCTQVPSPGIKPTNPLILQAPNLMSEYDIFASSMPKSVWVSGTNGKTTTTSMIEHLLSEDGALSGGNIGNPLGLLKKDAPLWILETSSFTFHYTNIASPDIYVLLPITPDHISWHGSFEEYESAKLKPLKSMDENALIILPKKYENIPSRAKKICYENVEDLTSYFKIDSKKLKFKGAFLLDCVIALGVSKLLFNRVDYNKMNSFKIDAHRQESFKDKKNRVWINDSKATNVDATLVLLEAYKDEKLLLILGGDDKGVDLTPLFNYLSTLHVELFLIGSNEQRLLKLCIKYNIKSTTCNVLENAVNQIDKVHNEKSVAILSPAAASLDQFTSYSHRGDLFKEEVSKLR